MSRIRVCIATPTYGNYLLFRLYKYIYISIKNHTNMDRRQSNSPPLPNPRPMYQDILLEGCSPPTFTAQIIEKKVPTPAVENTKPPAPAVENKKPPPPMEDKKPPPAMDSKKPIPVNKTPPTPEQKSPTSQARLCGEPGKIKLIGPPILKHFWITPKPAFSYPEYFETIPKPTVVNYK